MKKSGFTLAEVLITLGIVGFIAAITLPSLTTATTEKQATSALKKSLNSLTNIAQISQAVDGVDFGTVSTMKDFYDMVRKHGNVDPDPVSANKIATTAGNASSSEYEITGSASNTALMFRDGTMIMFPSATAKLTNGARERIEATGEVRGFTIIVDINGTKGPNELSTCTDATCKTRSIKDQFPVKVKGNIVVPTSHVTRWLAQQ